jgi:hypothetical protein
VQSVIAEATALLNIYAIPEQLLTEQLRILREIMVAMVILFLTFLVAVGHHSPLQSISDPQTHLMFGA